MVKLYRWQAPVFSLLAALTTTASFAQNNGHGDNLRELCRKEVSGAYLDTVSTRKQADDYVEALDHSIKNLHTALAKARSDLSRLNKELEHGYDVAKMGDRDGAEGRVKMYQTQLEENKQQLAKAKISSVTAKESQQRLKKTVETVFRIRTAQDPQAGEIFWRLDYKSDCPPYKALCPLPQQQQRDLQNIFGDKPAPLTCIRYSRIK